MTSQKLVKIEAAIQAVLSRMETTKFVWSVNDCDTCLADYVVDLTGKDPMVKWRGNYCNEDEAREYVKNAGGNLNLVKEGLAAIGIHPREGAPDRGDVVVMGLLGEQICGLHLGKFTAFKTEHGLRRVRNAKILAAWSCV